jgi:hypothetical protein
MGWSTNQLPESLAMAVATLQYPGDCRDDDCEDTRRDWSLGDSVRDSAQYGNHDAIDSSTQLSRRLST